MLLFALFAIAALFAVSGCKYSDVLTQHTEDPAAAVDETQEPTYESNPDAEERPDLANVSPSESEDQDDQVAMLPHYDPSAPDNGPTKRLVKSTETPHDEEASEGSEQEEPDRKGAGEGEEGGSSGAASESDNDSGENEGTGDELVSDEAQDPSDTSDESGAGDQTVVVDPDGTTEEPAKGTVAAVGEYATIAQMLGGAGALAACDQDWLDARASDGAFSGELDRVQVAFSGDGSKSGSCDVDALINSIQPSAVLWDGSKPALTEKDRSRLEAAGITVQSVPTIGEQGTEDYEVTTAVQSVAAVLTGASGLQFDVAAMLENYLTFHDNALKTCYDANGGYSYKVNDGSYNMLYQDTPLAGLDKSTTTRVTTVFVDDLWNPGVSTATVSQSAATDGGNIKLAHDGQSLDVSDGIGLSVKTKTQSYMLIDYYLQLSGVVNNAYDTAQPESQGRAYILMPGNTSAFGTSSAFASRLSGTAFFYAAGDGNVYGNWKALGDADFNTVLASSEEVASGIAKSAAKKAGLYRMENPYRIIVVPSGIAGSWAQGHVDSFLLAPWAFGIRGEANLDAARSYAQNFYSTFMRCAGWEGAIANWNTSQQVGS